AINFSVAAGGPGGQFGPVNAGAINSTALSITIASYVCPSDFPLIQLSAGSGVSQTSYFPSGGTWDTMGYASGPDCWQRDPGNGAFDDVVAYRVAQVSDGMSQTIFVGESSRFRNDPDPAFNQWSRYEYFGSTFGANTKRPQGIAFEVPRINAPFMP